MKTIAKTFNIYSFDELSEKVQKTVIEELYDINTDYEWWDSIYEDANAVEFEIEEFEIEIEEFEIEGFNKRYLILRESFCGVTTAQLILKNHGENCETFKLATKYLSEVSVIGNFGTMDEDFNEKLILFETLEKDLRKSLEKEYLTLLIDELNYRSSTEQIIETIKANEYTFLEDGTIYNEK